MSDFGLDHDFESGFLHVKAVDGFRSICKRCFRTVATGTEEELRKAEAEHDCPGSFKFQ